MSAISIKQPLVEHILRGLKRREYRSQATKIVGRVYLYASLKNRTVDAEWRKIGKKRGELTNGAIVGTVEIVKCVKSGDGYAYELAKPRRVKTIRKHKNQPQPRFWTPQF